MGVLKQPHCKDYIRSKKAVKARSDEDQAGLLGILWLTQWPTAIGEEPRKIIAGIVQWTVSMASIFTASEDLGIHLIVQIRNRI